MAIPSQARKHFREGVEIRRAAPNSHVGNGEGIAQTTNPLWAGQRKPSCMKIRRPEGRGGSSPPPGTSDSFLFYPLLANGATLFDFDERSKELTW